MEMEPSNGTGAGAAPAAPPAAAIGADQASGSASASDSGSAAKQQMTAELRAKRGSILLRSVSTDADARLSSATKEAYLAEQAHEAQSLTANAAVMHQLRQQEEVPPPPPPQQEQSQ